MLILLYAGEKPGVAGSRLTEVCVYTNMSHSVILKGFTLKPVVKHLQMLLSHVNKKKSKCNTIFSLYCPGLVVQTGL